MQTDFVPEINALVVFRGGDGRRYMNDLHILYFTDTEFKPRRAWGEWKIPQVSGEPPDPRANHSSAVMGSQVFIFGGWDGTKRLNDLHILDTSSMSWSYPLVCVSMIFDVLPVCLINSSGTSSFTTGRHDPHLYQRQIVFVWWFWA